MPKPTLCIIHEAIGDKSGIAKAAMWQVNCALDAGWEVSVVAKYLDESLQDRVRWLKLTVPRKFFLLKWLTARHYIRRALGGLSFDIIHAHQPQVADLSDVFNCHFLTRVAHENHCLESRPGARSRFIRLQQQAAMLAEDRCYRNWRPATHMLFCSDMLKTEFGRLYGLPPVHEALIPTVPPYREITDDQRRAARVALVGDKPGLVVGYLGGLHERKGYKRLIPALRADENLRLLIVGAYSQGFTVAGLGDRCRGLGFMEDLSALYSACDVFVVPSLFEPLGLVAFEAAAHGVPVIATAEVGALPHILEFGAGAKWNPAEPLGPLARALVEKRHEIRAGARRMAENYSDESQSRRLMNVYEQVLRHRNRGTLTAKAI